MNWDSPFLSMGTSRNGTVPLKNEHVTCVKHVKLTKYVSYQMYMYIVHVVHLSILYFHFWGLNKISEVQHVDSRDHGHTLLYYCMLIL